jgi:hypothetical protein
MEPQPVAAGSSGDARPRLETLLTNPGWRKRSIVWLASGLAEDGQCSPGKPTLPRTSLAIVPGTPHRTWPEP